MLSFQKLDVYRCAIEFLALTLAIAEEIPRGNDALTALKGINERTKQRGTELLERIVAMLTKLCR